MIKLSLRWRLPLSYAAIALLTAVVLGGILLLTLENFYQRQERDYLENSAGLMQTGISRLLESSPSPTATQIYIQNLSFLIQARIRLLDEDDAVLVDSGSLGGQQFIYTNLTPQGMNADVLREGKADRYLFQVAINVVEDWERDLGENPVLLSGLPTENTLCGFGLGEGGASELQHSDQVIRLPLTTSDGTSLGVLEVSEGVEFGGEITADVARAWSIAGGAAVIIAALAGWVVSQRMVAPLTSLTKVTEQMALGDLSVRAQIRTRDEFGALGTSFNTMAERIEDIVETLRSFVADAAHALHTPLTTIKLNLEMALEEKEAAGAYLHMAGPQVDRMEDLVDNLLSLSRVEANDFEQNLLSLSALFMECAEKYTPVAAQAGISLAVQDIEANVSIQGDALQIQRAIDNLLDNAVKFTPSGGAVKLELRMDTHTVSMSITDTGIGIPPEDMPKLFRRFHRGRNAAAYPGSGLGLAISRAIIDRHDGEVVIGSGGDGTTVTIILPR